MLLITHPASYPAERAYAYGLVVGEFLGVPWRSQVADGPVTLTLDGQAGRLTVADRLFATPAADWLTERSLPTRPVARWRPAEDGLDATLVSPDVPLLYAGGARPYADGDDTIAVSADLFGSVFFLVTRYEEAVLTARDSHERFPFTASVATAEDFLERPLANEYVELLRALLARVWPGLETQRRAYRLLLSHDVDWPRASPSSPARAAKAMAGDIVRRRSISQAGSRARSLLAQWRDQPAADPFFSFDFIMDESERRGIRSAFYFLAGSSEPQHDADYELTDPWIEQLIRRIHDRGHELGLHPSYGTFRDPDRLRDEFELLLAAAARLGITQPAWGGRQHFLRWENPTTWRAWEAAGLAYDSTLGYSGAAGFRSGVCYEHPVFDLRARRALALRERPLVVMEQAIINAERPRDEPWLSSVLRLRDRCRMFGGDFALLWHNSRFVDSREKRLYLDVLDG